jgi:large subunit ribosomal protein L17
MRHGKKINHLGRTAAHRKSMLSNMAISLITHKRINTTLAKAKALRKYIEPILTRSKENTTHNQRIIFSHLQDKKAMKELFGVVSPKISGRPGGYTRILRTGFRVGDNAEMCMIELVDFNEVMLNEAASTGAKKTRRSRRKKSEDATAESIEKKE